MLLSAGQWHGDTAFQLKRIRQRRQHMEAAEDFPVSGAGIKLQQERLAASAAAASTRNKALQQSLAEAAAAQRPTAAGSMYAQLLALTGAYMNLVRTTFPAWAAQAGPSLQERQLQQSYTVSSWYAGPAPHLACSQHTTPAGAGKQSFRFNIPQPAVSSSQHHLQQQQQRQHQPMKYALSPQRCAGTAHQQDAAGIARKAGAQVQVQQAVTAGAAAEAGTHGQASTCTQERQQQQPGHTSSDPFMTSLQEVTSQLALLQQALSSHQQLQQQQQLSPGTEPRAAAAGLTFSPRSGQPGQPGQKDAAAAAGAPSPGAVQAGAVAAAGTVAGSVMPASSNCSCNGSPVATSANPASQAQAAADLATTPKMQRLIQARQEQQQQQANPQSSDGATSAAAAAHSTAAPDSSVQGPPEQSGALPQPVDTEAVIYTVGRFKVQQSPPSRPASRTPSMPNSHAPTPRPDSPGADDGAPAGHGKPPQQQGLRQQAESAAADDGDGGGGLASAAVSGGSGGGTGAGASAAALPCASQHDATSAAVDGAASMPTVAEDPQDMAEQHQQKQKQKQKQKQQPDKAAVCVASFSQAGRSEAADVLQVDAVAVVTRPSTATTGTTTGTPRLASKSPPPPPPLPQQRQQQKLSAPAAPGGVGGSQQQQGEGLSEASASQPAGRSTHSVPQQAESRQQQQQQMVLMSPRPNFGIQQEQACCTDGSPSRRTSLAAGAPAPAAAAAAGGGGGGGSSAAAGSLSPTASLHLHQQLVFSPLQLGSVSWKAPDSTSVTASPGAPTGGAGTAAAAAAAAAAAPPHMGADTTASPGGRAVTSEVLQQQLPGALQLARALSGEAQQLVFSPLRLSSTSLPAPALSPTAGTADTNQVQSGSSQREQEQGHLSQQGSAASGSSVVGQARAAMEVAGQEDGPSTQQQHQQEGSTIVQQQVNSTEAAGTAAGPATAMVAGEQESIFAAPPGPNLAQPGLQEPTGPNMPLWEQAVFSPLKSATAIATGTAAAAAAGSTGTLSSPTQPAQLAAEGLVVSTDRQEVVFSPLRLGAAGGGGSVSRGSFGVGTHSPHGSAVQQQRQASPQRQQQQQQGASPSNGSSSVHPVVAFLGSLSPVRVMARASSAGSGQRPSSQLVLLSGSAVTQQQQQQSQRLGINSLAVGLGPRSPAGAMVHSTLQQDNGSRVLCTHSSSGGAPAAGVAVGPLHSNLGYTAGTAAAVAALEAATATAGGNSLSSSIHIGLLLSPATRLSLGGASTVDEAAWSSGRPSLGSNAGDGPGEAGRRLSVGPPGPVAAPAVTGMDSRGLGGVVRTTGEGLGGVSIAGGAGAGVVGGPRQPVVMASWSSMSSNASGNVPSGGLRVPRLSLPPTLHVPDAPVPGSGSRSGASSHRCRDASTTASLGQQQQQQQGSSSVPAQLPPPPPELLAHLRQSQQQQQSQQGQRSEQVPPMVGVAASQFDRSAAGGGAAAGGSAAVGPCQGIGSCRVSSGGAAPDRDRLVSKVLNTGLTEFSFEEEEEAGGDDYDDPDDGEQEVLRQQDGDDGSGSDFGGD